MRIAQHYSDEGRACGQNGTGEKRGRGGRERERERELAREGSLIAEILELNWNEDRASQDVNPPECVSIVVKV